MFYADGNAKELNSVIRQQRSIILSGIPGTGKFTAIRNIADALDRKCVIVDCATMTPLELTGFEGKIYVGITEWQKVVVKEKNAILVLEVSSMSASSLERISSYLKDRKFSGGVTIPDGTTIIVAIQPNDGTSIDEYGSLFRSNSSITWFKWVS